MKLTGTFAIYADVAALNCNKTEQADIGQISLVKKVGNRPYASGQAWRHWWRNVLYNHFGWNPTTYEMVKAEGAGAHGYAACDPVEHEDDDLFGYMRAEKGNNAIKRTSPLHCSALSAIHDARPVSDFGVLSVAGDNAVFQREVYSAWMAANFSLDLERVGVFEAPLVEGRAGGELDAETLRNHANKLVQVTHDKFALSRDERKRRVRDLLKALTLLEGGANLARNNTDVTPQVLVLTAVEHGNAILQGIFKKRDDSIIIDIERLKYLRDRNLLEELHISAVPGVVINEQAVKQLEFVRWHSTMEELVTAVANLVDKFYDDLQQEERAVDAESLRQSIEAAAAAKKAKGRKQGKEQNEQQELADQREIDEE
ncbi:MAG: hypothetical protein KatS3mg023_3767 [Armatimonadota bacterium]|nr:MAG: hypothetical protein KatS3mg023_3767 [Armatimonadota bacterium]